MQGKLRDQLSNIVMDTDTDTGMVISFKPEAKRDSLAMNNMYYNVKPYLPRKWQIYLRRLVAKKRWKEFRNFWPILENSNRPPSDWNGWPEGKQFALILTHDVERAKGHDRCIDLIELEKEMGFRSSFNFVPERYKVSPALRELLTDNGFEVGVHGLYHDGKLYKSKKIFMERAQKINYYLKEWQSVGFRSPAMHHNLDWIRNLNIQYDLSTFDTDPFEPQSDGVGTIFPFIVPGTETTPGYVELPYTLVQDFTLFIILRQKNIKIWEKKIDWIVQNGGMILINLHPDYMNFENRENRFEEYPIKYYYQLLTYIQTKYSGLYWHALPKDAAAFFRKSTAVKNVQNVYNYIMMNTFKEMSLMKTGKSKTNPMKKYFRTFE
jgi:hypothetical protein